MAKNLRYLLAGMLLMACGLVNPLLAQLVTTNPTLPTDNQETTFIVDLTKATDGRAKVLLGKKDDIYLWSGAGSTETGDAFQFTPAGQADFSAPYAPGTMTSLGNDRWQIKLVPRTYYRVPVGTPIRKLGLVIKSGDGKAQTEDFYVKIYDGPAITTQALAIATICPGSTFDVPFTISGSYASGNVFTVQLSNGGDYTDIATSGPSYSNTTGRYTVTATIPATTPAGTTYKVRVNASNPAVIGTPSTTQFAVKIKPGVPAVANQSICQVFCLTPGTCEYVLSGTATQGASILWYSPTGGLYTSSSRAGSNAIILYYSGTGWSLGSNTLYASQALDGCESDRISFKVEFNPNQYSGPSNDVESKAVCLNSGAVTLDKFLSGPTPTGFNILYYDPAKGRSSGSTIPPVIKTDVATTYIYSTAYVSDKGCSNTPLRDGTIYAKVKPLPAKPTPVLNSLTYCQNQTASSLVATTTDASASLVWYGTEAISGTGSATASKPATDKPGTFKYYVAQRLSNCESDRAEIIVVVKDPPASPTVAPLEVLCGYAGAVQLTFTKDVNVKTVSGATAKLYDASGNQAAYQFSKVNGSTTSFSFSARQFATSDTYKYPVNEITFYATQVIDGCESNKVATLQRVLFTQVISPSLKSSSSAYGQGYLAYCQGETAQPLNVNGHDAAPPYLRVIYKGPEQGAVFSSVAPTPSTTTSGKTSYTLRYQAVDSTKACVYTCCLYDPNLYLTVEVKPRPSKPTIPTNTLTLCQNQLANPLSATTTDTSSSLVWYGTDATSGTGVANATKPNTDKAGTFKYYVAQRQNDCEGDRAEIIVEVKAASPTPMVTSVSYCVGAQAGQLSAVAASGGALNWYSAATGGTGSGAGPTPPTANAGGQTYYVSQTVGTNCESQRVALSVTITGLPSAPTIANANPAFCQNAAATPLSASGQNLAWYEAASGGTASGTVTPNTSVAGTKNFYVSQTINNCEGPRASLSVTVKPLPAAPAGTSPTAYCQFAKGEAVAASGQNLIWYNADDSQFGNGSQAPVLTTDVGRTFTYKVTQTVDGCVSPKATLNIVIQTTPVPTVAKSVVELCQGSTAQPLEATGEKLKWTDPTGAVTTTAPVPPTLNATKNPDGDIFYVTQTGSTGCESARAAIKVFIQTVPTLSLSGANTVNLGIEAPIKLSFTGVGPYSYTLSNGLMGNTTKDTTVLVLPTRTTIYQIAQVKNKCGVGLPGNGATVTITVMVPGIQTLALTASTLCVGTQLTTNFLTTGSFNTGSAFKLQFAKVEADSAKIAYADVLNGSVSGGQITGTIPTATAGGQYWVRVIATNPKIPIYGTISPTLLTIRPAATAALTGTQSIYETQTARLSIAFTGEAPWTVMYQDSSYATGIRGAVQTIPPTAANPYVFEVKPDKTTAYKLTSVSNDCGVGTRTTTTAVITVSQLLAVEEPFSVDVFPVPATASVTVRINGLSAQKMASLQLTDVNGRVVQQQQMGQTKLLMLLDQYPAGTYILRIQVGEQAVSKRIMKL